MADHGDTTAKHKAWTNYDVFVALSDKLDDSELRAEARHLTIVTEIEAIKGTLRQHDARLGAVERRDAPRSHGIALAAMAIAMWLMVLMLLSGAVVVASHAR